MSSSSTSAAGGESGEDDDSGVFSASVRSRATTGFVSPLPAVEDVFDDTGGMTCVTRASHGHATG